MKEKISKFTTYYKAHPKRFWIGGGLLVLVLILILTNKPASTVTIVPVVRGELKQTVLATGQVTSKTDLDLAFSSSGLVRSVPVSVGDKVWAGQVLASLDNASEYAALKSAQARYQKVVAGSSSQDVAVAEAALRTAKTSLANAMKVQDTLVANAHRALLNADLTPALSGGTSGTAPTVTGTYSSDEEGSYVIVPHVTGSEGYFTYSGVESGTGTISTSAPKPLGTRGLYIQFSSDFANNASITWTVLLPNPKSASYLSVYNAYQNALKTRDSAVAAAEDAVAQAEANLALKQAPAQSADLAVAQADVDAAQATYQKTLLIAPAAGTVTRVDTKVGERVDAQKAVVVIQDVGTLYVEADINETSISKVVLGQPVVMTLDAFGPDAFFTGSVIHIDPSASTVDGIANYKIKASIKDESGLRIVRPGMNANMTITAWEKASVIAVPKAAVTTVDGVSTVRVVTNEKKNKTEARTVTLGAIGDGNRIEILSGLTEGEKIAVGK
jgi:RND family efflux transporter MFP subunit